MALNDADSTGYIYPLTDCNCPDDTDGTEVTDGSDTTKEACICDVALNQGYQSATDLSLLAQCLQWIINCLCALGCLPYPQENYVIINYTAAVTEPLDLAVYFDPTEPKVQYDVLWNGRKMYAENNDYTVTGTALTWTLAKEDCVIELVVRRYKDLKAGCA